MAGSLQRSGTTLNLGGFGFGFGVVAVAAGDVLTVLAGARDCVDDSPPPQPAISATSVQHAASEVSPPLTRSI